MPDEENSKSPVADSSPATSQTNQNEENKESPTSGLAVIKIIIIILLIAIFLYTRNKMVTQNKNIPYDPVVNAPSIPINNTYDNQELSEAEKAKQREKKAAIDKLYAMGVEYTDELAILSAYNNPKKLDLLLKAGADVNFRLQEIDHGATTLYKAVAIGNVECVKLLLNAPGIKVNLSDMNGKTPLLCAADKGHTECVKLLLADRLIDVYKADNDGKTPLQRAESNGHTEIVKLLKGPANHNKRPMRRPRRYRGI
ncbi:MAG: ankyrin repeat domain-containing protein [Akkermansia sp.]|nr:ankyrin repeat domain-containing protein [Akkermansia sp.]